MKTKKKIGMVLALLALSGAGCSWGHVKSTQNGEEWCGLHVNAASYGLPQTAGGQARDWSAACREVQEARALGTYANLYAKTGAYFVAVEQRQAANGVRQAAPAVDRTAREAAVIAQAMAECAHGVTSGCRAACALGYRRACTRGGQ